MTSRFSHEHGDNLDIEILLFQYIFSEADLVEHRKLGVGLEDAEDISKERRVDLEQTDGLNRESLWRLQLRILSQFVSFSCKTSLERL